MGRGLWYTEFFGVSDYEYVIINEEIQDVDRVWRMRFRKINEKLNKNKNTRKSLLLSPLELDDTLYFLTKLSQKDSFPK